MSMYSQEVSQLKEIIATLEDNVNQVNNKSNIQRQLCTEYVSIFEKFSKHLATLVSKINEHAAKLEGKNSQTVICIFKALSQSLTKIANSSKSVAMKGKNQILDPLKLFSDNYLSLNKGFIGKLRQKQTQLNAQYSQLFKYKQGYIAASQRLQKGRKTQGKLMAKIQNGDISELQKFNSNIRKITQNIKQAEDQYAYTVKGVNRCIQDLRKQLREIATSLTYNQQSRISFTKKALICSIKNLKDFNSLYNQEIDAKLQGDLLQIQNFSNESILNISLNAKIANVTSSNKKEEFVPYQEMLRRKRKKMLQQENSHLIQIFSKIKEEDKATIRTFVKSWFKHQPNNKQKYFNSENRNYSGQLWESCRQKIITVLHYSYFFIEAIYEEITQMSSIYCKLSQDNFMLLLELFSKIIQNLKIEQGGSMSTVSIQFLYRMIHISMRVMWKKNNLSSRGQPIQLLSQHLGKRSKSLQNQEMFIKLYSFLQKKKIQKKGPINTQASKSMMDSFMKGMQEAMNMKKQTKLSQQQIFSCLTQLTYMMANLLTINEVAIPVLKKLLGKGENTRSFEYLKSILFEKKDQQQRQKIFFRTEVKGKIEQKMKKVIQDKKIAEFCLQLVANRGFLGKQQINLRLVCRQLKNVHQDILYRLDISPQRKWINIIPLDKKMNYANLKKEVEQNKLAPSVEQIIMLDVNRSLHNHADTLSQETLKLLLRIYANNNHEIGYCQGMNYIAGYCYIKTLQEEKAYRLFHYLMETRFKQLFANEFQILKIKLYQFQRLLAIFHPEVSDHFKKQGITSECYIVAWIITVFASSYQYTKQSYLIDLLWERFIIWGWREFFRFVLAIFNMHKEEIIELTYDRAMHFLGNIAKSDIIKANKQEYKMKYAHLKLEEVIDNYQISQELLESLQKQYDLK